LRSRYGRARHGSDAFVEHSAGLFVGDRMPVHHWLLWDALASNAALALWDIDGWAGECPLRELADVFPQQEWI
jgi:hypothetical protein